MRISKLPHLLLRGARALRTRAESGSRHGPGRCCGAPSRNVTHKTGCRVPLAVCFRLVVRRLKVIGYRVDVHSTTRHTVD